MLGYLLCKTHKSLYVQLASIDAHKCRLENKNIFFYEEKNIVKNQFLFCEQNRKTGPVFQQSLTTN